MNIEYIGTVSIRDQFVPRRRQNKTDLIQKTEVNGAEKTLLGEAERGESKYQKRLFLNRTLFSYSNISNL